MAEGKPAQGPILLTEDQCGVVELAVARVRDLTGNPLLDECDALVFIADEYLRDADELAKLRKALPPPPVPVRRIALVE